MRKHTLIQGQTAFMQMDGGRGRPARHMITCVGEHTVTMFYIPRVQSMRYTMIGKNVTVVLGSVMQITMPSEMWDARINEIIEAAMGINANGAVTS